MSDYECPELDCLIEKVKNGVNLTEKELKMLVQDFDFDVVHKGENGRWTQTVHRLIDHKDELYIIEYEQGLTEYQENEYYKQPYRVKMVEKTITVKEYVKM